MEEKESMFFCVGWNTLVLSMILDFVDDNCGHDAVEADLRNSLVITVI